MSLSDYLVRKILLLVLTMFVVAVLVFVLVRVVPGDIINILLGSEGGYFPERVAAMRTELGIDKPIYTQLLLWGKGLFRGDFGVSLRSGRPVLDELMLRLPVTFELMIGSTFVALVAGILFGVTAAVKRGTALERYVEVMGLLGLSIPEFWWGTLLILGASLYAPWIPTTGYVSFTVNPLANIKVMMLPILTLGLISSAVIMRMTRSTLLEILGSDFITVARAKGLTKAVIIFKHALRNALIPVITVAGVQAGQMLGGAIVVEQLFALPGVGRFVLDGILGRDYPVIQLGVLVIALAFAMINTTTDVLYAVIDPRVRH